MPDCLKPPNGAPRKCFDTSLIQTKPACTAAAVRCAVERSLVQIEAVRPYSTALDCSSIFASSLHLKTESTGPKISSRAMRMVGCTSANTVGSIKKPLDSAGSAAGPPPQSRRPPSCLALSMKPKMRSYWVLEMIDPMVVAGSVAPPGLQGVILVFTLA